MALVELAINYPLLCLTMSSNSDNYALFLLINVIPIHRKQILGDCKTQKAYTGRTQGKSKHHITKHSCTKLNDIKKKKN